MHKIFLIGGGELTKGETVNIDKFFLSESGGDNSRLLFFPTAAFDSDGYAETVKKYFSDLGCSSIKIAKLSTESRELVCEKINWASGIYLGGGSTSELIRAFNDMGVVDCFKHAIENGVVLAGMSAGAMCLGKSSVLSEISEDAKFGEGFNILPELLPVAHYDKKYEKKYISYANENNLELLGIPEKEAVFIDGDKKLSVK